MGVCNVVVKLLLGMAISLVVVPASSPNSTVSNVASCRCMQWATAGDILNMRIPVH